MITYNKLVRDRIPAVLKAAGKQCETRTLNHDEYAAALDEKLGEELQEYKQSSSIGELADIVEVIYSIVRNKGVTIEEFEHLRLSKHEERGGFDNRLLLVSVTE